MAKIFIHIVFLIGFLVKFNESIPSFANINRDISMKSNRFAHYASPLYNAMRSPSDYQYQGNHYPTLSDQEETEPETFYVKMDIDSNEDADADLNTETKYVNIMIDTKPRV
ncbi:unnamed protein product [Adineta ricciae]|uniref:Uncharacterized protein n=1 Tax=Adineta ricciae TaxID=249248 RepID=A0A814AVF6_ADIRI|nr:unnamed protein product [Adineta ricciae]